MPRLGPADIRIRDVQGNVRATVDVAGDGSRASVSADASTDGVVAADVQGDLHRDAFDASANAHVDRNSANASARVTLHGHDAGGNVTVRAGPDGLGVRAHAHAGRIDVDAGADRAGHDDVNTTNAFAGFRVRGDRATTGMTVNAGPDGLSLRTDVDLGPVDVNVGIDSTGRVSAALEVGGEMVDGLDVRFHARRTGDKTSLGGGTALRLSRFLALPDVKIDGETERTDPTQIAPDDSRAGKIRAQVLASYPGAKYEQYVVHRRVTGGAERKLTAGIAGLELGFAGGKDLRLTTVRLRENQEPEELGPDADELATLKAGERFELEGQARMSLRTEASGELSPLATRIGTSVSLRSELIRDGKVRVVIDKEEDEWARVRLHRENTTEGVGAQSLHGGPAIPLPMTKLNHFAADLAVDYARSRALDWLQNLAPVHGTREASDKDQAILEREFRLDLSHSEVREALDAALAGDWTALDSMVGHAGVLDLRHTMEKRQKDRVARSVQAFGLKRTHASVADVNERLETTSAGSEHLAERSWKRSKEWQGWLGTGRREMSYVETERTSQVHQTSPNSPARGCIESVIEWHSEQKLKSTKPRQLQRALGMAMLLGEETIAAQLRNEIQERHTPPGTKAHASADASDEEPKDATLRVALRVDDDGIQHATSLATDQLWRHAIDAWFALHPDEEPPVWAKPGGRESLDAYGPLRHGHADYAPYHEVRVVIDTLTSSTGREKHDVMRTLRDHLAEREQDPFWVAFLAKAVGPSHRQLAIEVDEAGDDPSGALTDNPV